jgi:hypothetical protein
MVLLAHGQRLLEALTMHLHRPYDLAGSGPLMEEVRGLVYDVVAWGHTVMRASAAGVSVAEDAATVVGVLTWAVPRLCTAATARAQCLPRGSCRFLAVAAADVVAFLAWCGVPTDSLPQLAVDVCGAMGRSEDDAGWLAVVAMAHAVNHPAVITVVSDAVAGRHHLGVVAARAALLALLPVGPEPSAGPDVKPAVEPPATPPRLLRRSARLLSVKP